MEDLPFEIAETAHTLRRAFDRRASALGVTRGRRLVVVVGQRKALAMAVRGGDAGRRWSKLKERLAPAA